MNVTDSAIPLEIEGTMKVAHSMSTTGRRNDSSTVQAYSTGNCK